MEKQLATQREREAQAMAALQSAYDTGSAYTLEARESEMILTDAAFGKDSAAATLSAASVPSATVDSVPLITGAEHVPDEGLRKKSARHLRGHMGAHRHHHRGES